MNGRNVWVVVSLSFLAHFAIFMTYSKWPKLEFTAKYDKQIPKLTEERDQLTDNVVNGKSGITNVISFRDKALQKRVWGKKRRSKTARRMMADERKTLYNDAANGHMTGKENTNESYFVYNEESLYASIQRVRTMSSYKPPKNEICKKRVPKCIIIGVKKSGTRELIDFMSLHPNIVIKRNPYELGYFSSRHYSKNSSDTEWYRNKMPCSYSDQITVTKYPWYFSSPVAAQRIYNFNNTIKLIVLVREPVERLISGYTFENRKRTLGIHGEDWTRLPPIERRLLLRNGKINKRFEEVKLSSYDTAIMNYLKFFTFDQILIIESNDFKNRPHLILQRVESFLGLQPIISAETFAYNENKQFYCIRYQKNAYCYGKARGRVMQPEMTEDIRRKLKDYFRLHNERFFGIIGERYNW